MTQLDANHDLDSKDPLRWRILIVLLATISMSLISVSIVNVALPSIQESLHSSQSDLQWVLSGYALTFGVTLVAAGRAGDIFGRGGLFIFGVFLFAVSSVVAGFAPSANWLNGARFVQGIGSGILSPQGLGMIQQYFRGAERGRAFGYFGSMVGVSVAIGPVLGGVLIQLGGMEMGWRYAFLINVPMSVLIMLLAYRWFPRPLVCFNVVGHGMSKWIRAITSLDPVGSILLGLAVLLGLLPFVETHVGHWIWSLLPLSLLLTYLWVKWERYYAKSGRAPMVDLDIFSTPSFANGSVIVTLYFLGMTSIWVIVALYMQEAVGKSAFEAGLVGIPASLLSAYAANWAGKRVHRLGRKIVIGGIWLAIFGMLLSIAVVYWQSQGYISVWWLVLSLAFVGVAQGTVISPNQTLTLEDVPLQYAGSSGAIMQTGQRIGTSIGIAVITAVVFGTLHHASWAVAACAGFGVIAAVMAISLIFAYRDLHHRKRVS
ncbi:MAG: MFS transporter [Venatoribacter sp.]